MEDELLDVLQNIEFAIVSVYREHDDLRDTTVMRSLDALISLYRAESRGHHPKEQRLSDNEKLIFDHVRDICEFRLGRMKLKSSKNLPIKIPVHRRIVNLFKKYLLKKDEIYPLVKINTVDEILSSLRRIRKSVDKWNKQGGQKGYLSFVAQFMK